MDAGRVAILLVYEPHSAKEAPVPIVRLTSQHEILSVARAAIVSAEARAVRLSRADEIIGQIEKVEVDRLRQLLTLLIPSLQLDSSECLAVQ
jgi:hypothetical protein